MARKMNKEFTNCKKAHTNRKTRKPKSKQPKRVMLKGTLSGKRYLKCSLITDLDIDPIYDFTADFSTRNFVNEKFPRHY